MKPRKSKFSSLAVAVGTMLIGIGLPASAGTMLPTQTEPMLAEPMLAEPMLADSMLTEPTPPLAQTGVAQTGVSTAPLPNLNRTGNLTVHNTGLTGHPTSGEYQLYGVTETPSGKVNPYQLTSWQNAIAWADAENLSGVDPIDFQSELRDTQTVSNSGIAHWSNLAPGLYYVFETEDSDTRSLPFLVTIPTWDSTTNQWQWDITHTPKPAGLPTDVQITVSAATGALNDEGNALIPLTVEIRNNGPERASAVKAMVELPELFTEYQENTGAIDWPGKADGTKHHWERPINFGSIHFDVGDLETGHAVTYQTIGKIPCSLGGELEFSGHITQVLQNDVISSNDNHTITTRASDHCQPGAADLKIAVSSYTTHEDTQTVSWTITAKNGGNAVAHNTQAKFIIDAYHPEVWEPNIQIATGTLSPITPGPRQDKQLLDWNIGDLNPGQVVTLAIEIPMAFYDDDYDVCMSVYITSPDDEYVGDAYDRKNGQKNNDNVDADTDQWDFNGWNVPLNPDGSISNISGGINNSLSDDADGANSGLVQAWGGKLTVSGVELSGIVLALLLAAVAAKIMYDRHKGRVTRGA